MATISLDRETGRRRILFIAQDGTRKAVRLGKVNQKQAETIRLHVEDLLACKLSGTSPKGATSEWVAGLPDAMRQRLGRSGLITPVARASVSSLTAWVRGYIDGRAADSKPNTRMNYEQDFKSVAAHFGDKLLGEITSDDADAFRAFLKAKGLGEATIRRRCKRVKQFFKAALKRKMIAENPFADMACSDYANSDRQRFVTRDEIQAVLDACARTPNGA